MVRVERCAALVTSNDVASLLFPLASGVVMGLAQGLEWPREEALLRPLAVLVDVVADGRRR